MRPKGVGEKRRFGWLSFRFKLSTFLLSVAFFALLSVELSWRRQQALLAESGKLVSAKISYGPRGLYGNMMHFLTFCSGPQQIQSIEIEAYVAHNAFGGNVIPAENVMGFLHMPGMQSVPELEIAGTSFNPEVLREVAKLPHLRRLHLDRTAINPDKLRELFAFSNVNDLQLGDSNSPAFYELAHVTALHWTRQVEDLYLAREGDINAAHRLLHGQSPTRIEALRLFREAVEPHDNVSFRQQTLELLSSENPNLRWNALHAFACWGDREKVLLCLQDRVPEIRLSALHLLKTPGNKESLSAVADLLYDPEPAVVNATIRCVAKCTCTTAEQALIECYHEAGPNSKALIISTVANSQPKRFRKLLEVATNDTWDNVRLLAIQGLSRIKEDSQANTFIPNLSTLPISSTVVPTGSVPGQGSGSRP